MLGALKRRYWKEQHLPSRLGLLINPYYFARRGLLIHVSEMGSRITGRTLDVGCGHKPYQQFMASSEYVGLEIDTPANREKKKADSFYDGKRFPFDDFSFDSVICNQVFEHVFNPDEFLDEIKRVLKPGGSVLLTVPFVWDEHEQPYDYGRYSSFGLKHVLERHGLLVQEHRKSINDVRVVFQLFNAYLYKKLAGKNEAFNLLATLIFMAPVNITGAILGFLLPANPDLFLDNVVLAKKES
jgi:SAM-dependent methyltransferase